MNDDHYSSAYWAGLLAECLSARRRHPQEMCRPDGAQVDLIIDRLVERYELARDREQARGEYHARELVARFPQLAGRAA